MTATLRTQRARSRQAQSGAKRVEVVLDAGQLATLERVRKVTGDVKTAITYSLAYVAAEIDRQRERQKD
jgi:hypothetical protein